MDAVPDCAKRQAKAVKRNLLRRKSATDTRQRGRDHSGYMHMAWKCSTLCALIGERTGFRHAASATFNKAKHGMSTGQPGVRDYVLLVILAAIWGSSFLFIKVAVAEIPAVTVATVRIVVAALILWLAARMAGQAMPRERAAWIAIVFAAFTGNAVPFTLIGWGEEQIDSGLAAILMATMPLTTLLLAHVFTSDEKLTVRKTVGVSLGLAGLIVLMGPERLARFGDEAIRELAVAGAATCYGINALITKRLVHLPRRAVAAAMLATSAVIMVPASLLIDRPWTLQPGSQVIVSVIVLGIFHTAIATMMLFAIVRRQGASFFSQINFLVPLFGVAWGALVLAERPSANALLALALILIGIAVVRGRSEAPDVRRSV
jgi:drug/metabolite transporter (DMT)-like permease